MINVVGKGLEGFSKDTSLSLFGNPLIQVGDVIQLSYNLAGVVNQNYFVHSVSNEFTDKGLVTNLTLNQLSAGSTLSTLSYNLQ